MLAEGWLQFPGTNHSPPQTEGPRADGSGFYSGLASLENVNGKSFQADCVNDWSGLGRSQVPAESSSQQHPGVPGG